MDTNIMPEQAKQSLRELKPEISRFNPMVLLIVIFILVIMILAGIIIFLLQSKNKPLAEITPVPTVANNVQPTAAIEDTVGWKTYVNSEVGFSFKYPASVLFGTDAKETAASVLRVDTEKLADIPQEMPSLMGRKDAILQKELLQRGEGDVLKIGTLYGSLGMILSRFEICSVILSRTLTFYPNDYRVIITLDGPKKEIMDSMPDFFTVDTANCGNNRMWNQDKKAVFADTLAQKNGKGAAQEWYDTFGAIVKTVSLIPPSQTTPTTQVTQAASNNIPTDWLTYKNYKYGFEISYPKSYKALDSKSDLYGYPKGAVLLYDGGQAYDVIIEAWDKQSEYESNYGPRMSDVTVINNNGKYITIMDDTHEPDNKGIIASFKLLP